MNQPPVANDSKDTADLRRARELLPWFTQGQLDDADQTFMTLWLENTMAQQSAVAAQWQLEIAAEQAWLLSTRAHLQAAAQQQAAQQAQPDTEAQGLAALMQRIAQTREENAINNIANKQISAGANSQNDQKNAVYPAVRLAKQPKASWQDRIGDWLGSTLGVRSHAMAFGIAAVVLVQAGVIGALLLASPAQQVLLSGEPTATAPNSAATNQVQLTVAFNPQTTELAIRELLAAAGAQILSGPSALGLYIVAVPAAKSDAAVAKLRAAKGVVESVQR